MGRVKGKRGFSDFLVWTLHEDLFIEDLVRDNLGNSGYDKTEMIKNGVWATKGLCFILGRRISASIGRCTNQYSKLSIQGVKALQCENKRLFNHALKIMDFHGTEFTYKIVLG